jgi:hypothetical protein
MNSKDLVVDGGGDGQEIEDLHEVPPVECTSRMREGE